jgi:C-terminal processing protease CtpA/Prc
LANIKNYVSALIYFYLLAGDAILKINDQETSWMDHQKAKSQLQMQGNEINLTIERFLNLLIIYLAFRFK